MLAPLRPEPLALRTSTYAARATRAMPPALAIVPLCRRAFSTFPESPFLQKGGWHACQGAEEGHLQVL